jgi:transcriptional regulator with PAS, ATPase and Fis domain
MIDALRSVPNSAKGATTSMIPPIAEGIDLQEVVQQVKRHYLQGALLQSDGNKTKAAKLVGLPNYQTFTNWMKQCGLE